MVQLFTSAAELAAAKRRHRTDMNTSPRNSAQIPLTPTTPSEASSPGRTSHQQLVEDKRRCQTPLMVTPRRSRSQAPSSRETQVVGHDHEAMEGPPYHFSAREFAQEKKEHMTPIMPQRRHRDPLASPSSVVSSASSARCSSYEAFKDIKRVHGHQIDSCSVRRRSHSAAVSSCASHCTSGQQYNDLKRLHLHQTDSCREGAVSEAASSPRRHVSCQRVREDKQHHVFEREPALEDLEKSVVVNETMGNTSHRKMAKAVRRHNFHVEKPEDEDRTAVKMSPHESLKEFEKAKKYHEMEVNYSIAKGAEPSVDSPHTSQRRMQSEKATLKYEMEVKASPRRHEHCISNNDYSYGKARHRHEYDSCRRSARSRSSTVSSSSPSVSQCRSNRLLTTDKHLCRHNYDAHTPRSKPSKSPTLQCSLHSLFQSNKRAHRHEIDSCTPRRERSSARCESVTCSSNVAFTSRKRTCSHSIDDCRKQATQQA